MRTRSLATVLSAVIIVGCTGWADEDTEVQDARLPEAEAGEPVLTTKVPQPEATPRPVPLPRPDRTQSRPQFVATGDTEEARGIRAVGFPAISATRPR